MTVSKQEDTTMTDLAGQLEPVVTLREFADACRLKIGTVYAMVSRGQLEVVYPAPRSPRVKLSVLKARLGIR